MTLERQAAQTRSKTTAANRARARAPNARTRGSRWFDFATKARIHAEARKVMTAVAQRFGIDRYSLASFGITHDLGGAVVFQSETLLMRYTPTPDQAGREFAVTTAPRIDQATPFVHYLSPYEQHSTQRVIAAIAALLGSDVQAPRTARVGGRHG